MTTPQLYQQYTEKMQRIADVRHAGAVLQWDQETYLPPKGAELRGRQISTLSEISHQLFSQDELGNELKTLMEKNDLTTEQKRNVELTLEDYTKNKKYSSAFVLALSNQVNKTFHSWIEARRQNSFKVYSHNLAELIELKKQEAEILGYEGHPYNALVNEYEKGCTTNLLDKTFDNLVPQLKSLLQKIWSKPQVDDAFLLQHYPKQQQWEWGMHIIKQLHFDFDAGRQDKSEHPFSTSFGPGDVRITTRISESDFGNMTWSCIHETGHALYEQGLPAAQYGLPLGEACSYSIHESQSRLWENNVSRSLPFWKHHYTTLQKHFREQLGQTGLDVFYKGINKVQASLVRTEADEITYHFHVYIRYVLEKGLIEGSIAAADIPAFWKEQYKLLLDVDVPDDKTGSLQDVHWSHGSFGYFPTYSLGSFYAAQFFAAAQKKMPSLEKDIEAGNTQQLLQWLRTNVHDKGRFYTSEDLCRNITGKGLEVDYFLNYLLQKYSSIYTL